MTCFCSSALQFYMHTFHPHLIEGVFQEHILVLTDDSYVQSIKKQLLQLNNPDVIFINREEHSFPGNYYFRVTVRLGRDRSCAHSA